MTTTQPDSSTKPDKPGTKIQVAGKEVNLRLTYKNLKHAKIQHAFDLAAIDLQDPMNSKAWHLITDPVMMIEACWAFHEQQLSSLGFTEESFYDAVDETVMPDLRERMIHACAGFFPFVMTLSTMLRGIQPGSQTFQLTKEAVAQALNRSVTQTP